MAFSDELDARLQPLRNDLEAGAFGRFAAGDITLDNYREFLCQTFQFAKHVPRFFGLAMSQLAPDRMRESSWYYKHGAGEIGHHVWALNDLKAVGVTRDEAEAHLPNPGTYALITASYYEAGHGNPVAVMGSSWAIEGMIAHRYAAFAENVKRQLGLPDAAVTFIARHAKLDEGHSVENVRFLDEIARDAQDREAIGFFAERTLQYYAQYFEGILRDSTGGFRTYRVAPELAST